MNHSDDIASHEDSMHAADVEVTAALFGPMAGGSRVHEKGLVARVSALHRDRSERLRLSRTDRLALVSILVIAAADLVARIP